MSMKKPTQNIIIYTDLDGTLLDHTKYTFDEANEMLSFIKSNNIPLILTTSKTLSEVIKLQKKLDITYPFIFENGAGICIPEEDNKLINLGFTYNETIKAFNSYQKEFNMKGFHEMDENEVAKLTNLDLEDAILAKDRSYAEPFILEDKKASIILRETVRKDGFDIVKGGRFYHLVTKGVDKANGVKQVTAIYEEYFKTTFSTIALGDGENDLTMLSSVDTPILIPKYDGTYISCPIKNITKAKHPGPKGWNETLKGILQ